MSVATITAGTLYPVGTPVQAGVAPTMIAMGHSGKFAYVTNYASQNVSAYSFDAATGALVEIAGSPFNAGTNPWPITLDPSGSFAYVVNHNSHDISAYSIDAVSGALTQIGKVRTQLMPSSMAIVPGVTRVSYTPRFAFVANWGSDKVSAYTINASTGGLTRVTGSPFDAGSGPFSVAIDPSGNFVYVANVNSNNLSGYSVSASTGALTPVAGSPFDAGTNPRSVTVDPSGRFVFVANYGSNRVAAYSIDRSGALTSVGSVAAGSAPWSLAVDPTGRFAYVGNYGSANVSAYTINNITGELSPDGGTTFGGGTNPISATVDPSGQFVYLANFTTNNISAYAINATDGGLTQVVSSPFDGGSNPSANPYSVAVEPSGKFLYVANFNTHSISGFAIGANGALAQVPGSPFPTANGGRMALGPVSIAVDPSGQFVYVANYTDSNISGYRINASTGALNHLTGSPFPLDGVNPRSIVTSGTIQ